MIDNYITNSHFKKKVELLMKMKIKKIKKSIFHCISEFQLKGTKKCAKYFTKTI